MIYVLIVIALFAGLSFVLARQGEDGGATDLSAEQTEIYATQILESAMQIKQGVDTLIYSGTAIDQIDFTLPTESGYDSAPNLHKIFHPDGGGMTLPQLPAGVAGPPSSPAAGWYLGRFGNVEWTPSPATDVVLAVYNIAKPVCEAINRKITGLPAMPQSTVALSTVLVDPRFHGGAPRDFDISDCPDCEGKPSICIEDRDSDSWSFFALIETR